MRKLLEDFKRAAVAVFTSHSPLAGAKAKEAFDFRNTLDAETDRGCALMAGAYLDNQLNELLKAFLVDDAKTFEELSDPRAPIGTFSARIDLCFMLGLISTESKRTLHIIRKIRNDFGHDFAVISFNSSQIASRCRALPEHPFASAPKNKLLRLRFTGNVMAVLASIHYELTQAEHRSPNPQTASVSQILNGLKSKLKLIERSSATKSSTGKARANLSNRTQSKTMRTDRRQRTSANRTSQIQRDSSSD